MKYRFQISRLPIGETTWEWAVDRSLFAEIGANYDIEDLQVTACVRARREARYLRLQITLQGWVIVPCDRGLEPIQLPIETTHEQLYSWDELYLPPEDIEEYFAVGPREDTIDLTQALYDYIGLGIPRRRVRPSCPDAACPAHVHAYLSGKDH